MHLYLNFILCCFSCFQVNKKDKSEPKTVTITPSENTHFRVILSTEAMEEQSREGERTTGPICSIVKPEPRTIKVDQRSCKPQPPEASSHDTNITNHETGLSNLMSSCFTSEPCPTNTDLRPITVHKTRWKSSPPSRRGSDSAASGGRNITGDSAAVCPDTGASSKPTDSPVKRRSNSTSFITRSENVFYSFCTFSFFRKELLNKLVLQSLNEHNGSHKGRIK